jgi:hypothetical protein
MFALYRGGVLTKWVMGTSHGWGSSRRVETPEAPRPGLASFEHPFKGLAGRQVADACIKGVCVYVGGGGEGNHYVGEGGQLWLCCMSPTSGNTTRIGSLQ